LNVEFVLPGGDASGRIFLTWTPVEARARLVNPQGSAAIKVTLRNAGTAGLVRFATTRTHLGTPTLSLTLPASGAPVRFFVAGQFGRPSVELGDAVIEARAAGVTGLLGSQRLTVRIRKDAQTLSSAERDRFLAALATLNGGGSGRFRDFRDMHVFEAIREAHGNVGFLPWHRAYILDLERELQAIDPSIALPYWRFDRPAPNVFNRRFMGVPNADGRLQFTAGHPFGTWRTDGQLGIIRRPMFDAASAPTTPRSEIDTLALGGPAPTASYGNFRRLMEGNPHGSAHTSFNVGFIRSVPTAARDPLFFMLHANVDRLWAKWQWINERWNPSEPRAFAPADPGFDPTGHRLADTMWPWNGVRGTPRPSTAPGGTFAPSPSTAAPGNMPRVRAMIDYQAVRGSAALGFSYDDVPFQL
jgi:tyrosinase